MSWATAISTGLQVAGSLLGGGSSGAAKEARHIAYDTWQTNKDLAYNGVQHRVADAKKAGIHPLYALGYQGTSVPTTTYDGSERRPSVDLASMGQGIGRAIHAVSTQKERQAAAVMTQLQLENQQLQNDFLRSQIAQNLQTQSPAAPSNGSSHVIPGQGNAIEIPSEIIASSPADIARQAGNINEYQYTGPTRSGYGLVPSKQMKERLDDDFIASSLWHLQNRIIAPPPPKEGFYWNPLAQRYQPNPFTKAGRKHLKW